MKFYYFGGSFTDQKNIETPSGLEDSGFTGVMFTYDATQGDMFIRTAKDIKTNENIKYLIAIRPYTISPQYLQNINDSMNEIDMGRLELNFIAGYIKDHENDIHGIVGNVDDNSESVDKSNYMIKFIDTVNTMKVNKTPLNFYVSTTNRYVFEAAKKYKNKIILPYHIYKRKLWSDLQNNTYVTYPLDIKDLEVMVAMTPIFRDTEDELKNLDNYALKPIWKKGETTKVLDDVEYFTYESFVEFVSILESDGIGGLLINAVPREERDMVIKFVKKYVESKNKFC